MVGVYKLRPYHGYYLAPWIDSSTKLIRPTKTISVAARIKNDIRISGSNLAGLKDQII